MNPAAKHAAEALAIDLATTKSSAKTITLTEPQLALKIPPHLVYLCGLCLIVSPDDEKEQSEMFRDLQKVYQETKGSSEDARPYRWSPSLSPCKEAVSVIQADLTQKQEQLARQATEAAQELLNEESKEKESIEKKVAKNKKKVAGHRTRALTEQNGPKDEERWQQENQPPQETLEDIMFSSAFRTVEEETGWDNDGWTEVTKKQGSATTKTGTEEPSSPQTKDLESPSIVVETSETVQPDPESSTPLTLNQHDNDGPDSSKTNDNDESEEISQLRARILQLETELASQQRQLQQERVSHQKTLQQTVESYEERMQGLQLRLYISETRLKTFEEALEQHVEAVATNTAPPTSPRNDDEQRKSRVLGSVKRISE